jgi:Na+/H+-dicarboxylate symporter
VCFLVPYYFGSIDDGWRAAFPIHQDIIISNIPLESMKSASQGLKSQSCSLPMTTNYCREKMLALIIFSFLIGFACLRSGEKGAL